MSAKSLKVNAALSIVKSLMSIILPFITFPYISRILLVDSLGAYNFSASIVSYFTLIAGLGISTYSIREGARIRTNTPQVTKLVSQVYSINVISTIVSYILLLVILCVVKRLNNYSVVIWILSLEILFTTWGASWICNIFEDFLLPTIQLIFIQFFSFLLILIFVKSPSDLIKYVLILSFSKGLAAAISHAYIRKNYCNFHFTLNINWEKHFKPIFIIFSTNIAIAIYVSSDTTMIGLMLDDHQVGLYSMAVKIYTIIKNLLVSALIVLIPRFSIYLNDDSISRDNLNELFSNVFRTLMFVMLPCMTGLFITSTEVVRLVGGIEYVDSAPSLRMLCIAIMFSLGAYIYTQCILIPLNKEKFVFISTTIGAIVNIVLNLFLIPMWGIVGSAFTTVIAELIVFIMTIFYSQHDITLKNISGDIVKSCFGCFSIVFTYYICSYFSSNYLVALFMTILFSVVIYCAVEIILKNSTMIVLDKEVRKLFIVLKRKF